jgi:arylsulfatase
MRSAGAVVSSRGHSLLLVFGAALAALTPPIARTIEAQAAPQGVSPPRRPNIVLIVADDLGYSDLGAFGGEIDTPNLNALAKGGVRFTNFYTAQTCSPTRAMLFSGVDTHLNGLGSMEESLAPNQHGKPGYEGVMNHQVVSFVNLLRAGGYHTYMSGKWHLGKERELIPRARGFERDFTLLEGEGSYFADMTGLNTAQPTSTYTYDGQYVSKLPKDFYATEFYVDKMIEFVDSNRNDGKPFFAYLAHQAPHAPYHLPDARWTRKYQGKFDRGWDVLRKERFGRMKDLGILPANSTMADRFWYVPPFDVLAPAARVVIARKMELFAALVENMDYNTGRFIDYLKRIGEYDNTLFVFFADNGAEGNDLADIVAGTPGTRDYLFYAQKWNQTHPNAWGRPGSNVTYGPAWAQVSATPFREHKALLAEGGIRSPLVVAGAGVTRAPGSINHSVMHVKDLFPTFLEVAGISVPATYEGKPLQQVQGKSQVPMLTGKTDSVRTANDYLGWEFMGNHAIRQGDWKLLWEGKPWGKSDWELFNLAEDPGEKNDLAAQQPDRMTAMAALWDDYVKTNNVIMPSRSFYETSEKDLPMRTAVDDGWPPLIFNKPFIPPPGGVEVKRPQKPAIK